MSDSRHFLLDKMESRLKPEAEKPRERNGKPTSLRRHLISLSQAQEEILQAASAKRQLPPEGYNRLSYIAYATLSFASYDLGLDVFEVFSGEEFPHWHEARARSIERLARDSRGQWGIVGLADHHGGAL